MGTLYTFGDIITRCKTESVHFLGLVNSATKTTTVLKGPRDLVSTLQSKGINRVPLLRVLKPQL